MVNANIITNLLFPAMIKTDFALTDRRGLITKCIIILYNQEMRFILQILNCQICNFISFILVYLLAISKGSGIFDPGGMAC